MGSVGDWDTLCKESNIDVETHHADEEHWKDMDLPDWVYSGLPSSNASALFNIGQAFTVASPAPGQWTTIQIVVPIVSAVAAIVFCGAIFLLCRRKKTKTGKGSLAKAGCNVRRLIRDGLGTRKVRKGSRSSGWVIDSREDESFEVVDPESPGTSRSSKGHVRLGSSPTDEDFKGYPQNSTQTEWAVPGKNLWRRSSLVKKISRTWTLLPVPWRRTPVAVHSTTPNRRFQIDDSSRSVKTDSTLENYRRGGYRTSSQPSPSTESGRGTMSVWDYTMQETIYEAEEEEEDDLESILGGLGGRSNMNHRDYNEHDEQERLITPNEDVLIISHSGQDFSVESGESRHNPPFPNVPPSPSTERSPSPPRTPQPPRSPPPGRRPKTTSSTINTPPAPSYPAPLPPASPPRPPRSPPRQPRPSIENLLEVAATATPQATPRSPPLPVLGPPPSSPPPQLPDIAVPSPLYTPSSQHSRSITQQASSSSLRPRLPLPPSLSPRFAPGRLSRSTEQLAPPAGPREPSHSRSGSSSNISQYSLLCSPPYRSSPLPEEVLIARSDSPPPPLSGGLGALGLYEQQEAPPYHIDSSYRRELPVTPNPTHRRALSDNDVSISARQYRGFGDIATLDPNVSTPIPPPIPPPPPPLSHAQSSESLHYTTQMYPGPVRAAVSTDSTLLTANGSELTETPRTTAQDARWYPEPSIA
ncbi:hypothetical protein VNI00_013716 [Paramarasmius palmivorus]|uniref:Transmembrane protein n=1 Tax=Paramarasmius palmivorus TaxID=297713 RepID=A0AAW0BVK5_9AGAR